MEKTGLFIIIEQSFNLSVHNQVVTASEGYFIVYVNVGHRLKPGRIFMTAVR